MSDARSRISAGGMNEWRDSRAQLEKWDAVYGDIRDNGFKEVKNNMSVTRDLVFVDGKHRLAMARALGLDKVIVRIVDV